MNPEQISISNSFYNDQYKYERILPLRFSYSFMISIYLLQKKLRKKRENDFQ